MHCEMHNIIRCNNYDLRENLNRYHCGHKSSKLEVEKEIIFNNYIHI